MERPKQARAAPSKGNKCSIQARTRALVITLHVGKYSTTSTSSGDHNDKARPKGSWSNRKENDNCRKHEGDLEAKDEAQEQGGRDEYQDFFYL
ncbi:MAG: hypothetical protein CL912_21865 [Deltaproteobacteria bacterium]|nr:hypothetical protein [Deltaproteobacteria bacterium]